MKHFTLFILLLALLESCSSKKKQEIKVLQLDSITADSYRKLFSTPFGYGQSPFDWTTIEVKVTDEEKKKQIKINMQWVLEENIDSAFLSEYIFWT